MSKKFPNDHLSEEKANYSIREFKKLIYLYKPTMKMKSEADTFEVEMKNWWKLF